MRHVASPVETVVTPDHSFWVGDLTHRAPAVGRGTGLRRECSSSRRSAASSKLRWKEIGEAGGDALLLPRRIAFELPDHFEIDLGEFARATVAAGALPHGRSRTRTSSATSSARSSATGDSFLQHQRPLGDRPRRLDASARRRGDRSSKLADCVEVVTGVRPTIKRGRMIRVYLYSLQWARLLADVRQAHRASICRTRFRCGNPRLPQGAATTASWTATVPRRPTVASASRTPRGSSSSSSAFSCFLLYGQLPERSSRSTGTRAGSSGTTDDRCNESFVVAVERARTQAAKSRRLRRS